MESARPIMVATFVTKMLISVTPASRLMTAIELGRASATMRIGSTAPTTVPKTASRISIAIGRLITSAWTRSFSIAALNSCWMTGMPVTTVSTPSGASTRLARCSASWTASSRSWLSRMSAKVFVPSRLRNEGSPTSA